MATPTAPTSLPSALPPTPATTPHRGLVMLFALISLVTIFALDVYAFPHDKGGPLLSAPFWLPYLFVILRLRGKKPKSGLALAIAMGCAMVPPATWLIPYARSWDANWRIQAGLAVILVAQLAVVFTAIFCWRSLPRERGLWRTIIANGVYAAIALIIMTSFLWHAPDRISESENSAIWTLQAIRKAESSYNNRFGVYPAHLTALSDAPGDSSATCKAAGLLSLAVSPSEPDSFESRGWGGGYVFEYSAATSTKSSADCRGASGYQLQARPRVFGKTGHRSFLIDQSGAVRSTVEDRSARVTDPPIQTFASSSQ